MPAGLTLERPHKHPVLPVIAAIVALSFPAIALRCRLFPSSPPYPRTAQLPRARHSLSTLLDSPLTCI